ncbi:asparaginase [Aquibacillus koreensis]|uniref:asparaginase n=1 Tax=Aquibacillus koreensis TaxID=279446 RepID=A0A9X4AI24_9BACI|nr:asparaginase [Aquibacillus koreensis]MCT2537407.1 asparaginase [Aquibacillus koreensis]MDC3418853.1 asparaginase [Aquibacillus koreensis]
MKRIVVIHTGGTIAMKEDKSTGTVSTSTSNPLTHMTHMINEIATVEEQILFNLPSPHITPDHMLKIAKEINNYLAQDDYDGAIITHGTDTLEETAYFLDLYLDTKKPVVVTGAMRSSNELGSDGPYNMISAIRVATSEQAFDKGVLVVMNDEIHTAKYVTKTSTSNVATFQSPQFGPIGMLTKQSVYFYQKFPKVESYPISTLSKKVAMVKAYAGMDDSLIEAFLKSGIDGLVIEGLGQGNVPKETIPALKNFLKANKPVILVSRCFKGIVQPTYGYEGGGMHLKEMGVIFASGLTGQKARLKLLFALEITSDITEISEFFDD